MMWFIKLLQKRPSDNTIKIGRIIFGLVLSWSLYYNLVYQATPNTLETNFFWIDLSVNTLQILTYVFIAIGLIPIIMGFTNLCLLKKKYMRFVQAFFWIMLFYISSKIVNTPNLDVDVLIFLMWFLPLIAWITWKCITTKCLKYKEKITKIRV
jgi:hypothetical protein